jgi:hypothetical protein
MMSKPICVGDASEAVEEVRNSSLKHVPVADICPEAPGFLERLRYVSCSLRKTVPGSRPLQLAVLYFSTLF